MSIHVDNKHLIHQGLGALFKVTGSDVQRLVSELYHDDAIFNASHPINELVGHDAITSTWQSLREALPDAERRDEIVLGGADGDAHYVSTMGHVLGTFDADWLNIPATGKLVQLRYGEIHRVTDGRIRSSYTWFDLLDLMRQSGCWPIMPSLGTEGQWPGPASCDGLRLDEDGAEAGAQSVALMKKMHDGLLEFDGKSLESMSHRQYWADDFMWYGPSGIGTTRGINGFEAYHQIPFLKGFPDRGFGDEYICFGDGHYAATGGWVAMRQTHTGDGWLGLPATGKVVTLRVMDLYRVQDHLLSENWVLIDLIDVLKQMGVDVFARLRHLRGNPQRSL
ncbi:MAG: ester cyclase [Woeseia sp.]